MSPFYGNLLGYGAIDTDVLYDCWVTFDVAPTGNKETPRQAQQRLFVLKRALVQIPDVQHTQ